MMLLLCRAYHTNIFTRLNELENSANRTLSWKPPKIKIIFLQATILCPLREDGPPLVLDFTFKRRNTNAVTKENSRQTIANLLPKNSLFAHYIQKKLSQLLTVFLHLIKKQGRRQNKNSGVFGLWGFPLVLVYFYAFIMGMDSFVGGFEPGEPP